MNPRWLWAVLLVCLAGCDNSPHPQGSERTNTLFMAFQERSPRYLDPTASYANNETPVVYHVHEPLYGYHYLKRPYTLVPKAAAEVVQPHYLDAKGQPLPDDAPGDRVAESVYDIPIRRGVMYAPHPAFARDEQGHYLYHALTAKDTEGKRSPFDFPHTGTRELVADDFVYAFKRHATPRIEAPVFGIFAEYVVGLKAYGERIRAEDKALRANLDPADRDKPFLDFRRWPLDGVQALDPHTLRIRIKGKYPQWKYWLAMTFAAPIPWEAEKFYAQPGMARNGMALSRWPVGTGPYMLREYEQDRRHVLVRNPLYHLDPYPCEGDDVDRAAGLLADCGKPMPFIDRVEFNVEKERVPLKSKFAQGYIDVPEIERVDWGVEFLADMNDADATRDRFDERGFRFPQTVDLTTWYMGFNMLDPVVGKGDTPEREAKNRKLRQALSIAMDWEEGYGRIFLYKAGDAAHGPLPAGIFGSRHGTVEGHNPVTHHVVDGKVLRRPVEEARRLLAEAGYPDGRDARTGRPLVLNYDFQRAPTPELKAELDWTVKQFAKVGVQLEIRATDFNQYQEKTLKGKHQIFFGGWVADYPDAENFLFLLYGPNSKSKHEGENVANYESAGFDKRFRQMQLLDDGPEKQRLIDEMVTIARADAPWIFGYHPFAAGAYAPWVHNGKPGVMGRDVIRYHRIDAALRAQRQAEWNRPVTWPLWGGAAAGLVLVVLGWQAYRRREGAVALAGKG
ncbi:ABC transporter substrate-binding protein [Rhizobacter sp. Root1221]|uniref:ABC transporter substrate-binding protein n=1 Tax=Rhizobacter sp. Root1221 TaxID=1736433 RepID=UPI0006F6DE22|nr:ABC transporter substrate-binding protein [Rhizobacter sp. Root1221]KQV85479.1 peptide ABC transporter substrate-binding protein [Rhizobacter sp. Root1221]